MVVIKPYDNPTRVVSCECEWTGYHKSCFTICEFSLALIAFLIYRRQQRKREDQNLQSQQNDEENQALPENLNNQEQIQTGHTGGLTRF